MESISFLTVNDDSISLSQSLRYLRGTGKLPQFLTEILRQYVLDKELQRRSEIQIDAFLIDQAIMDFRLNNQLSDPNLFRRWLANNAFTYEDFYNQIAFNLKIEQLKNEMTEAKIEEYFIEKKPFIDQVVISRIIVAEKELAADIKQQLLNDKTKFEQLAREKSITNDRFVNGMIGAVSRGQLPEALKTAIESANPGDIIGPLEIEGRYCIFRVEQFINYTLEEGIKQDLQNQMFEQWLQENLQKMAVKLEVF